MVQAPAEGPQSQRDRGCMTGTYKDGPCWDEICACMGGSRVIQNDGHLHGVSPDDERLEWHTDHARRRYRHAAQLKEQKEKANAKVS